MNKPACLQAMRTSEWWLAAPPSKVWMPSLSVVTERAGRDGDLSHARTWALASTTNQVIAGQLSGAEAASVAWLRSASASGGR